MTTTLSIVTAAVLSGAALAQGRHDEKPHGMTQSPSAATEQSRTPRTGGRHDEGATSHGKKPAAKKGQPATEGGATGK